MNVTIAAGETGTAIMSYDRDAAGNVNVTTIERLPAGLAPAVAWLTAAFPKLPVIGAASTITIDGNGLGQALWSRLKARPVGGWRLYGKVGRDRQELATALLIAQDEKRVHISPSPHADALRKALLSYHKTIGEDGILGGELITALALACLPRPRPPRVYGY
jgi:hypothetical protein